MSRQCHPPHWILILTILSLVTLHTTSDAANPDSKPATEAASKDPKAASKDPKAATPADGKDVAKESMDTDDGDKDSSESAEVDKCNTDLIRAFGMQGRVTPTLTPLEMCPTVRRSCCRVKDQLSIYAAWKKGGQERLIRDRFGKMTRVYMRYLNVMNKIWNRAEDALEKNLHQRLSNCNILAQRIKLFKIDDLILQVRNNLQKMERFFKQSFKGFYCAVCNYDNHKFFDLETKTLNVADDFCYWTVSHSLRVLLFFYEDIVDYNNVVSQYMMSCNMKSEYRFSQEVPGIMVFKKDKERNHTLRRCRDHIKCDNWLDLCRPICDKFSVVGLSRYFEPNMDQIELYTKWLKALLVEKRVEETQPFDIKSKFKKKKSMSDLLVEGAGPVISSVKEAAKSKGGEDDQKKEEAKEKKDGKKEAKKVAKKEESKAAKKGGKKRMRRNRILTADKPAKKEAEQKKKDKGTDNPEDKGKEGDKKADAKDGAADQANGVFREDLVVYRNDLDGKFPLAEFGYKYSKEGIDFRTEGINSLFGKKIYMQIKILVHLATILENKPTQRSMYMESWGGHFKRLTSSLFSRSLKSVGRLVGSFVISLGLLGLV